MEEIIISIDTLNIFKKFKIRLERLFNVKICVPEVSKSNYFSNDIIVVTVSGESRNISYVKNFMEKKIKKHAQRKRAIEDTVPVITLSDSDSDNAVAETRNKKRKCNLSPKKTETQYPQSGIDANLNLKKRMNENGSQISSTSNLLSTESSSSKAGLDAIDIPKDVPNSPAQELDDSIVIVSENIKQPTNQFAPLIPLIDAPADFPRESHPQVTDDSIIILSEDFNPPSNEHRPVNSIVMPDLPTESTSQNFQDHILCSLPSAADYISLTPKVVRKKKGLKKNGTAFSYEVPIPRPQMRRILRPIVIDGSNVARVHGKAQNTFSCKGIKISVEHFLKRGHTQVTAFLPMFRRHCRYGMIETTDQDVLDELVKSQNVVYTPSRYVNGRTIACYDDRFIVELASKNDGVILSNDNFRDIMQERREYKKTIEERLLMFCFVGDYLMIPDDPLGRTGPKLDTFLSMEEPISNEIQLNSLQACNKAFIEQILRNPNPSRV